MNLLTVFLYLFLFNSTYAQAASLPTVSIVQFKNTSAGDSFDGRECRFFTWFSSDLGNSFREILIAKLKESGTLTVLERETIKAIYNNEHELINAENSPKLQKGHFKRAKYTIAGVVSEFEVCSGGGNIGATIGNIVGVGDLGISANTLAARVRVELRLIDTETGEILHTSSGEYEKKDIRFGIGGLTKDVALNTTFFKNSPLGEAIRNSIAKAADNTISEIKNRTSL